MACDAEEVFVVAEVFGCAAAGDEEAGVFFGVNIFEGDSGFDVVGGLFACDVPGDVGIGWDFVHDGVIGASFWASDDDFVAVFGETEVRVEGVECFGGVADGHEDFGHDTAGLSWYREWG